MGPNYELTEQRKKELKNRFTYHKPKEGSDQAERYEKIRRLAKEYATELVTTTPLSREQSLAITHLEEVVFWANAAIARNE